jgi:hypothetical protein
MGSDRNDEKMVVRVHVTSTGRRRSTSSRRKKRDERRMVKRVFDWEWRIQNGGNGFSIENCERLRTENGERLRMEERVSREEWRGKGKVEWVSRVSLRRENGKWNFVGGALWRFTLGLALWILINSF